MNDEHTVEILEAVREIRDLMRLLAEPAVAERDRELRDKLRLIVGASNQRANAVLLMDGTRSQRTIHRETGISEGNLSTLVKRLHGSKLLSGGGKEPQLVISVLSNFFENKEVTK
jgi:hypothetical protein